MQKPHTLTGTSEACAAAPHLCPSEDAHSPFSRCWKEGENSLAVILATRASSWAFCAAVRAASALARECDVLAGRGREGGKGSRRKTQDGEGRGLRSHVFVRLLSKHCPPCGRA